MGQAFLYGNSGGTSLNFNVVGGTTQPTSPKENTIWVKTNVPIPACELSEVHGSPSWPMAKGFVYVTIEGGNNNGGKNFEVIKDKFVYVRAIGCIQNQDGTKSGWKRMNAYIYNSGKWTQFAKEFDGYLLKDGVWSSYACPNGITGGFNLEHITKETYNGVNVLKMTAQCEAFTADAVDLSGYSNLNATIHAISGGTFTLGVATSTNSSAVVASSESETTRTISIDIGGITGSRYIMLSQISGSTGTARIKDIYLT